jgi:CheY-like chemotaxis protein
MNFLFRHHNRLKYPTKHILVVEDVITNQKAILDHFHQIFEPEGLVQISVVSGALAAAGVMNHCKIDLIILDHDLPEGNGTDLLNWMNQFNVKIPVITFSGIPENNTHMASLGAQHIFGKGEVYSGKADKLINVLLGFNTGVAEEYVNSVSPNKPVLQRYWIDSKLMVGGNICDQTDWQHLEKDYGIRAVINIETPEAEKGITIPNLCEFYAADDGGQFAKERVQEVVKFAEKHISEPIYIHCHLGMSRSPHFGYAILRHCYKMPQDEALAKVMKALPTERHHWGFNQHTVSYIKCIEEALKELE